LAQAAKASPAWRPPQWLAADLERYNLLRVRMGGRTEFYATMFPMHQEQEQHQRRQYFTPGES